MKIYIEGYLQIQIYRSSKLTNENMHVILLSCINLHSDYIFVSCSTRKFYLFISASH